MSKRKVHLGDKVKDEVSGLTGIVVGITTFLHGCQRITIHPQVKKGETELPDTFTVDEPQCKIIKRGAARTTNPPDDDDDEDKKTGGPAPYKVSKY